MARPPPEPARPEGSAGTPPRDSAPVRIGRQQRLRLGWVAALIVVALIAFVLLRAL